MLTLSLRSGSIPVFSSLPYWVTHCKANTGILRRYVPQNDVASRLGCGLSFPNGREKSRLERKWHAIGHTR